MLAGFDGLDGLLCVGCRHCSDTDGLEPLVLQHRVVFAVCCDASRLQILSCPCSLFFVECEGRYELGLGGAVEEVQCMASTHAAEARNSDMQSTDGLDHFGVIN
jgi:hypothetical protein